MNSQPISLRAAAWACGVLAALTLQGTWAQAPVSDPAARVARLSYVEGDVRIAAAGARAEQAPEDNPEAWADAVVNRPIGSGDEIWLGGDGRAELQLDSGNIHLDHDTSFGFIQLDDDLVEMSLSDGAATIHLQRLRERETVRVETPNSSVILRRPGEYHVRIDIAAEHTIVATRSGEAEVVGGSQAQRSYVVRANEQGVFSGLENLSAQIDPLGPRTGFESWANDRERLVENSKSARYVSEDVIGYEDLDHNGEWLYEPGYGHVWTPLYVDPGWAPYRYGRWVRASPWGWTWIDDARWGFAPFHYGSWARVRNRWCWVPGPRHPRHHVRPDRPVFTTDRDHRLGGHIRLPPLRGNADYFGDNPKRGADFRPAHPRVHPRATVPGIQPDRQVATPARSRIAPSRERLEIMRAAESRARGSLRSEQQRSSSPRLGGSSIQRLRAAPAARPHSPPAPSHSRMQPRAEPRSQPRAVQRPSAPAAVNRSSAARSHSASRGTQMRTQKK